MNLFRSEEHVRRWALFNPASEDGFVSLEDLAAGFGSPSRRHLLDDNYLSFWYPQRYQERRAWLERIGKATPYWLGA
jgi:hypothetical protein